MSRYVQLHVCIHSDIFTVSLSWHCQQQWEICNYPGVPHSCRLWFGNVHDSNTQGRHEMESQGPTEEVAKVGYSKSSPRSISSLTELMPGDHIQVPSSDLKKTGPSSSPHSTSSHSCSSRCSSTPERCDGRLITHHLLVVGVIDEKRIVVIHKVTKGVVEEKKCYLPKDVTVLDYDSEYTGQVAIARARERIGEKYKIATNNCEHFVTEVRTGVKQCCQLQGGVAGGAIGAGSGAVVGIAAGLGGGALVGAGIGSVFPGVGTMIGGGVGAIVGLISGGVAMGTGGGGAGTAIGIKAVNFFKRKKKSHRTMVVATKQ